MRRDLTINSIALRLNADGSFDERPLDPANGLDDLFHRRLRLPKANSFDEDPVRAIRLYRFASSLGFAADPSARAAAAAAAHRLADSPMDRTGEEASKLFMTENAYKGASLAAEDGVLFHLFPSLIPTIDCSQNEFHHLPVLEHSLETLRMLEGIFSKAEAGFEDFSGKLTPKTSDPNFPAGVKLAALLHDVGKPLHKAVGANGKITFFRHEQTGGELVFKDCQRLRLPKVLCRFASGMAAHHMRLSGLALQHAKNKLTPRATAKLLRQTDVFWPDLFLLAAADALATRGPASDPRSADYVRIYADHLLQTTDALDAARSSGKMPINGYDVMEKFNITPGPLVGCALNAAREAFLENPDISKEQALAAAAKALKQRPKAERAN